MIKIKRIYEAKSPSDGYRIFIDRLWPRGLKKENAHFDLWLKEIAPSDRLRKWFSHDPKKWIEFRKKYLEELTDRKKEIETVKEALQKQKIVTLLYGAKDEEHNNAVVLKDFLN
ncbi:MAG: DUF488 domain-containing protein [Candidatus Eremiobacteraeota bacterium]|jgi:uncharacterized protein YeaO (DUF488 family)|nr:DUF488 domain-containing protein [Candidatus Eremiobacteraeota bacterium]MCL5054517.1 DUF488 domain-containing protein [Bacillota bacterium]